MKSEPRVHSLFIFNGSYFSPASLYSAAIYLRVSSAGPFVSSSNAASELSGLCTPFYTPSPASQAVRVSEGGGKTRFLHPSAADGLSALGGLSPAGKLKGRYARIAAIGKAGLRAELTQLVECQLPKLDVAGSNPVLRSILPSLPSHWRRRSLP